MILSLNNFSLSYLSDDIFSRVVDNVSFTVEKGKTLGIVGESGSGKTVTALSLIRLLDYPPARIDSGSAILYDDEGKSVDLLSIDEKKLFKFRGRRISCIFQTPMTSLNPTIRCGHQVTEAILTHKKCTKKEARTEAIRLFEEVDLPRPENIFKSFPHQISGGQRQRVMIAMAIACKPDILIADEPTTALDVSVQKTIIDLLRSLQNRYNMSIIFISHNLSVIRQIADFVVVMNKGKIIETNTVQEIFENPRQPYTMGLIACKPPLKYRLKYLPTVEEIQSLSKKDENFDVTEHIKKLIISERGNDIDKVKSKADKILSVKDLTVCYSKKQNLFGVTTEYLKAVDDVSFDILRGETLGILGESGCGKSTIARAITGLVVPTSGKIFLGGLNILEMKGKNRREYCRQLQMVFQDPYSSLNPHKTVGQALMEPLEIFKIYDTREQRRERVSYLLDKVGMLASDFDKYPHEFSGGQRQRVCIARALTMEPNLLICDEPVSSLDVSVQAKVLNLLQQLKEDFNLSMLFISHDISVIHHISDRVIVMKNGTIIEEDCPFNIINFPQKEYTRQLIEAAL
ncbi:MAG: ABC transporter ATP-binding protein [Bacteroidales bacterium]|nr:ABC transporter ATP-binding protein [Bacteroidales bacterium]MDD2204617.1 ABC transporter ATP-binding protein [Bacteroidales bacterium]MDD3914238.1 ABC transporter ATP-binding protein [Bacteroidales bacterium]MDD4633446.1 ABC transporter ATP-binding protein [Bacteroidales bacterium]